MADVGIVSALQNGVAALNNLAKIVAGVFPSVQSTATSASIGTHGAPPAQVAGYIVVTLPDGTVAKVPYYLM